MRTMLLRYAHDTGRDTPWPSGWDDAQTLGLVFGASSMMTDDAPLRALREAMPQVRWAGCSTAGAIHEALVRTVLAVDEAAGSITLAGDLPQGAQVRLMRASTEALVESAVTARALASPERDGHALVIAVSCVGRRLVMGARTEEELEALKLLTASGGAQIGFYSYGELGPSAQRRCALHNQTMTLTVICED